MKRVLKISFALLAFLSIVAMLSACGEQDDTSKGMAGSEDSSIFEVESGAEDISADANLSDTSSADAVCSHELVTDPKVEPTCTETGLTEGSHCSLCNEVLKAQEEIPMTDHSLGDWYITVEPTEEAVGERSRACSACGYSETSELPKLEHVHVYTETIQEATCKEEGLKTEKCACGDEKSETLPMIDHIFVNRSCSMCGMKNDTASIGLEIKNYGSSCEVVGIGTCTDTDIIIPDTFEGVPVTAIDYGAFKNCDNIKSVTIPDSVKKIREGAFDRCSSLVSVILGNGVINIEPSAFPMFEGTGNYSLEYNVYGKGKYLGTADNPYYALMRHEKSSDGVCEIHPDTKLIAGFAFLYKEFTYIEIPDGVESLSSQALYNIWFSDTKVVVKVPASVVNYGYRVFSSSVEVVKE